MKQKATKWALALLLWMPGAQAQSIWNTDHLQSVKQSIDKPFYAHSYQALKAEATRLLDAEPLSVMMKEKTPASGDKHDYMSQARYYWPDPAKPHGLPYINRDGISNPELNKLDRNRLGATANRVTTLALAWYFSGEERYAQKATELLRVWFLNKETRMNPNLEYAQVTPGHNNDKGRSYGLIDTYSFVEMLDAVALLEPSKAFTAKDSKQLKAWFAQLTHWMLSSPQGKEEAECKNNHSIAYDVQIAAFSLYGGKQQQAIDIINALPARRIAKQIDTDGKQPHELTRTLAFHYSQYNLTHILDLLTMARNLNMDTEALAHRGAVHAVLAGHGGEVDAAADVGAGHHGGHRRQVVDAAARGRVGTPQGEVGDKGPRDGTHRADEEDGQHLARLSPDLLEIALEQQQRDAHRHHIAPDDIVIEGAAGGDDAHVGHHHGQDQGDDGPGDLGGPLVLLLQPDGQCHGQAHDAHKAPGVVRLDEGMTDQCFKNHALFPPKKIFDGIQHLYIHLSPQEASQTTEQMGDRFPNGIGDPERSGEKEDGDGFRRCHAHQLFLIRPIQRTTAADRGMQAVHLVGKLAERPKNLRLGTLILHNGASGPLVDGGADDLGKSLEIALQQIGLLQRHSGLGHLDPDTAPASVFDDYFHFNLQGQKTGGRSPLSCVYGSGFLGVRSFLLRPLGVEVLGRGQYVGGVLLHSGHGFHDRFLHPQGGGCGMGIGFFCVPAGQQLQSGRAEQDPARKDSQVFDTLITIHRSSSCFLSYLRLYPVSITMTMQKTAPQAQKRCCFIGITST